MRYYYLSYDAIDVADNFPQGGSEEARHYILCSMKKIGFTEVAACTETSIRFGIPDKAAIMHDEIIEDVKQRLGEKFAFSISLSMGNGYIRCEETLMNNTSDIWNNLECD